MMIQFDFLYAKYTQNKATMEHESVEVVGFSHFLQGFSMCYADFRWLEVIHQRVIKLNILW